MFLVCFCGIPAGNIVNVFLINDEAHLALKVRVDDTDWWINFMPKRHLWLINGQNTTPLRLMHLRHWPYTMHYTLFKLDPLCLFNAHVSPLRNSAFYFCHQHTTCYIVCVLLLSQRKRTLPNDLHNDFPALHSCGPLWMWVLGLRLRVTFIFLIPSLLSHHK